MALTENMRGAALMAASMTFFTINDAFMKAAGAHLPLMQAMFLRGLGASLFLIVAAIALRQWHWSFSPRDRRLMLVRAIAEVVGTWAFLTALINMPFADVAAILQSVPLSLALAGALFLGERVGWRRWLAILIGFAGVMLIVRPGAQGFSPYALLVLTCVAMVTLRDMASRAMSAAVPTMTVAVTAALAVTAFAAVGALFSDWEPITPTAGGKLAGATLFLIGGYYFSIAAVRVGDIGFVAPFRYLGLPVALIVGIVAFGTFPDALSLVGAALVVATGIFTLYRERQAARDREQA